MNIRSYARAFPTDRRIYRIDRWAIPIPGGLPLAASAWFIALVLVMMALTRLPLVGDAASAVGWPATMIVAPGAGAVALTRRHEDGRTLPSYLIAGARWRVGCLLRRMPTASATGCVRTGWVASDHTVPGMRMRIHGPGRIAIADCAASVDANGDVTLRRQQGACVVPRAVALAAREIVEVRS